jgi:hypothetical protein
MVRVCVNHIINIWVSETVYVPLSKTGADFSYELRLGRSLRQIKLQKVLFHLRPSSGLFGTISKKYPVWTDFRELHNDWFSFIFAYYLPNKV